MLVCPTWGAMKCGCALHFGNILQRKSSNTLKKYNKHPRGPVRSACPLGALPKAALLLYFLNVLLDFLCKMWPKCRAHPHFIAPHVGHTSKSYDFLLKVMTFQRPWRREAAPFETKCCFFTKRVAVGQKLTSPGSKCIKTYKKNDFDLPEAV